ncbi:FdhF/YdeP family oxidoreductase [Klebsiella aerogenes]|uniref:FdhF/YdeP family oxidoreductase n=1 Tax=Klebsiella aerogenes TaxID=548 RepID=UPI000667B135|nr:FdhF/YdeP family oxidoreductase [Klebsiella aerogenes]MEB6109167.1 FdhF/YdeP family oxidoreductase [Klebsiella aerogenes]MEB6599501.1 FdhF/YdeP family oxidoreductase [Klebsiella aerogenes]HDS4381232.1 FdhF/YdeP family oxidoreductase [Klebsiella aerogenes]HDS4385160.1 FdhF/YdeP family oxidoreductase [Klebsiella aerogenes]
MTNNTRGLKQYAGAAGGWGAVKACTTHVLGQKTPLRDTIALFKMNQVKGFDCPGCAWPDPEHRSPMELCENGVKAVSWETTAKKATPEFFAHHTLAELWQRSDYELENYGRLTHPMKYDIISDTYQPVAWEQAFAEIGEIMRGFAPEEMEFYTSGRTSNEAAFLYQLYAREYGSNNFPDCSNMCHSPTGTGLGSSIGIGKGTVELSDFEAADLVICVGHNPGTNHPRMLSTLREVAQRGGKIISVNPLRERGLERFSFPQSPSDMLLGQHTDLSSDYFQIRVGGDAWFFRGAMKALLALDAQHPVIHHDFIAGHTSGYPALLADLEALSWDDIERGAGVKREVVEYFAGIYSRHQRVIISYGLGITQHRNGTQNVQQLVNLLLMRGNMGRKGAGICPLRGHSNVQGDRSVGINEAPSEEFNLRLESYFGIKAPRQHGRSSVESIKAIEDKRARGLICMGGNLAVAMPDPLRTFPAMRRLELQVHIATKLNRSHLLAGKDTFLFPALGRSERDLQISGVQSITVEDSMSMVHASTGSLKPASPHLLSEPAIVAGLARATLPDSPVSWERLVGDYRLIRDAIEAVIPEFHQFNARIAAPGGFRLDNPASRGEYRTESGKATFHVCNLAAVDDALPVDSLVLTTIRSHDQYNTTIYGMDDRYRGVTGRRDIIFLSEEEARKRQLRQGDRVNIMALDARGEPDGEKALLNQTVFIVPMAASSIAAYLPEANILLSLDAVDKESLTPAYKSAPVLIIRA